LTSSSTDPHAVVDRLFREEQGRAVATLIRVLGDFDLAEEAVQDAFIVALETWPKRGIPDNPGAWITTTARNRAIDRLRRRRVLAEKEELLKRQAAIEEELAAIDPEAAIDASDAMIPFSDDRLRLIFTCCHPALALDARVALTLRTLGGLSTPEIASGSSGRSGRFAMPAVRTGSRRRTRCRSGSTASCASST
jgi:RNA polymerase sigma-70 factor, ECF subfamily